METEHVYTCYIKDYVDNIRQMNAAGADIYMIDEPRSLLKLPNVLGIERHVDIKSFNRIVREGETKIEKYAKDEYLRLMRSFKELPRHLYDYNLPLYKML
jgi:hypothetical protein